VAVFIYIYRSSINIFIVCVCVCLQGKLMDLLLSSENLILHVVHVKLYISNLAMDDIALMNKEIKWRRIFSLRHFFFLSLNLWLRPR
jgi:hypothetical protein